MPGVLPTPLLTSGGGGVALTLDASSPPLVVANATTVTTASFTPPVGSLLVAFAIGTSFSGNPNAVVTSTGLTFTSQLLNNGAGEGTVQVFTSLVGAAGGSARTVNLSVSGYASCGLKVYVITGQHATLYVDNTSSGTSTANVINAAITTNNDGCMVLGGASEFIGLGVPTTTDAGEGLDDATGGVSYLAPRRAGETVKAGPELVNLDAFGASAASWYWILISIRPDAYTAPAVGKKADRGQASNTTTTTSTAVAMAAAGSITTGNYLIARVALDNAGTSGAAPSCTITDPRSNTWTVVGPANRTAASAANDGSTCYIAYAKVTNAYTNGDSLTVNHSPTTPAKAINVEEWYGIDATTPVAVAATTATGLSATPSIARTPLAAGQLFYGAISAEGPATDAFTQDTDITDGSWVTLTRVASANATAASNQDIYGAAKLVTGTTAQTWNPNIGTSRDWAQVALVFAPAAGGGVSADAALSGTGTFAATATATGAQFSDAALAGTATATATASGSKAVDGTLSGNGTLTATATRSRIADAGLAGTGTLSTSAATDKPVAATATATGTLAASATGAKPVDAALAGTGTLTSTATSSKTVAATLSATGTLTASATVTSSNGVDATLNGGGTLTATATGAKPVNSALSGSGSLAAAATSDKSVSGALAGTGVLTGAATPTRVATGSLAATGTLTASATVTTPGGTVAAALNGTGTLTSTALSAKPSAAALNGTATATAQMVVSRSVSGVLVGTGSLVASADTAGQVTIRPYAGTTARPTGRTPQPYAGTTNRP